MNFKNFGMVMEKLLFFKVSLYLLLSIMKLSVS